MEEKLQFFENSRKVSAKKQEKKTTRKQNVHVSEPGSGGGGSVSFFFFFYSSLCFPLQNKKKKRERSSSLCYTLERENAGSIRKFYRQISISSPHHSLILSRYILVEKLEQKKNKTILKTKTKSGNLIIICARV